MAELRTRRLVLRHWREADLAPFAALNADPEVMRHFPALLTRDESDAVVRRAQAQIARHGWGRWAVEVVGRAPFIGFIGLAEPRFEAHFTPAVEVGWRLAREFWGKGYATEGAKAAVDFAFDELGLDEVVSFAPARNDRSRKVMERLGMRRDPADDFEHPLLSPDDPLRPHVLYRLPRGGQSASTRSREAPVPTSVTGTPSVSSTNDT